MELNKIILEEALSRFDVDPNPFYVSIPTRISKKNLPSTVKHEGQLSPLMNPVTFLSRVFNEDEDFPRQLIGKIPYFSFIVGQYGLGKTELVTQTCRFILSAEQNQRNPIYPLPISLVGCRKYLKNKELSFGHILFEDILKPLGLNYPDIHEDLLVEIYEGRVMLLLDGLDELIQLEDRSIELHRWFLSSLAEYIASARQYSDVSKAKFRVVVSMREEYLSVVSSANSHNFHGIINPYFSDLDISLYFLMLSFFDESRILAYLIKRKREYEYKDFQLLEDLAKSPDFKEIFHRPLLLRLLVDWLEYETADLRRLIETLSVHRHSAHFIRFYIDTIVKDNKLKQIQDQILSCEWSPELIARRCLLMSEEGRQIMNLEDVRNILVPTTSYVISELSDEQVLAGIHKCPFLKKEVRGVGENKEIVFIFSHKIFFEYFTVEGVLLDLEKGKARDGFGAFDELVLSVDMRKFLKAFVGHKWYERTAIAYGLGEKDWEEWRYAEVSKNKAINIQDQNEWNRLNEQRKALLDTMSEPENEKEGIDQVIQTFLGEEEDYHPRYLVPNYEAISVFLWHNMWNKKGKDLYAKFEKVLEKRAYYILKGLRKEELKLINEWLMLLERVFDIGYRLRLPWIRKLVINERENIEILLDELRRKSPNVNDKVERILVSIGNVFRTKVWEE